MYEALRKGADIDQLNRLTYIKPRFIQQMKKLALLEEEILKYKHGRLPDKLLVQAKKDGFIDRLVDEQFKKEFTASAQSRRFSFILATNHFEGGKSLKEFKEFVEGKNRKPNRLINEKSPYLLQHDYNPVDWYPWGAEAFQKAKREGKCVFLSVGYS